LSPLKSLLVYGDSKGSGGYIRYLRGLLTEPALVNEFRVVLVASPSLLDAIGPIRPEIDVISHAWIESSKRWQRVLWHTILYPLIAWRIGATLEFYPTGQLRTQMRRPRTVTTCHNLLPFDQLELNRITDKGEREYLDRLRKIQSQSLNRADGVVFLSQHSLELVSKNVRLSGKSTVIAHGVDDKLAAVSEREYTIGRRRIVLYVSPIYTYKNHAAVISAIAHLRLTSGADWQIRFVGGGSGREAENLRRTVDVYGYRKFVSFIGYVESDNILSKEYGAADLFVFASSCETFGITLLEAMMAGLPIACARRSGLDQIAQDTVLYFDPGDEVELVRALLMLESNASLRRELGQRAHQRAQEYTWRKSAHEHAAFMSMLLEKSRA
jgi:glycosyltransferase involved in cell wall biosynthesis